MAEKRLEADPGTGPRALTAKVRRRSLFEPAVRFWWIATLILAIAMAEFLVSEILQWRHEVELAAHGTPVSATVMSMGPDGSLHGTQSPDNPVRLDFTYNGHDYSVAGWLDGRTEPITVKEQVTIRIDPNDPTQWTYWSETPPIGRALLDSGMMAGFVAVTLGISFFLRRRVLSTWTTGVAEQYEVIRVGGTSALAPASRVVHFASLNGRKNQRLIRLLIPQRAANPRQGEVYWLIHPPKKTSPVLAAVLYQ